MNNSSPWLTQLRFQRPVHTFSGQAKTDILIIGGGIAGISTAYYALQYTNKNVALLEADKIAHGATGHNAGQVTSYFERHFVELVEDFGLQLASEGQAAVESAWILLEEIITNAQLSVPLHRFTGYAGFSTLEQLMFRLEEERLREQTGLPTHEFLVVNNPLILLRIPDEFSYLYKIVPQQNILDLLETNDSSYIALKSSTKGCLNSALFCEQVVEWLEKKYSDRFRLYENSPVQRLRLLASHVEAESEQGVYVAGEAILCTNGFENIKLINELGVDINGRFHETVEGTIGYMAGYVGEENNPPTAISYFEPQHLSRLDPYMYLTRRPNEKIKNYGRNLTCIGGPENGLPDKLVYNRQTHQYPDDAKKVISDFLKKTHRGSDEDLQFDFLWHGLMGYTKNGVRLIGVEPCNERLYYNLGCNGIGILPSIYGGYRLGQILSGKKLPLSMFDVQDRRCKLPD
jgi:glycine/D-amino acid oxidase-like deaminating enzyme